MNKLTAMVLMWIVAASGIWAVAWSKAPWWGTLITVIIALAFAPKQVKHKEDDP